jgi:hypothetical protein
MSSCTPLKEKMSLICSIYRYANVLLRNECNLERISHLFDNHRAHCGIKRSV